MNYQPDQGKRKVIVNVCPTGMVPSKDMNPDVPLTPKEIVDCVLCCAEFGASIFHLHARDQDGRPTWRKEVFQAIIDGIRNQNDKLILCVTTSGRNWNTFEKRSECLELKGDSKPDMASLTLGSMNFIRQDSINSPEMIEKLALKMRDNDIKPELEVFEAGMIHKANSLIQKAVLSEKAPYFNLLLGSLGTAPLDPVMFAALYHLLPRDAVWSVAGIGAYQLDANLLGLAFGGNVRVGLEDNLYWDRPKRQLTSNEQLVGRIAEIIQHMDLAIASPEESREILGLI